MRGWGPKIAPEFGRYERPSRPRHVRRTFARLRTLRTWNTGLGPMTPLRISSQRRSSIASRSDRTTLTGTNLCRSRTGRNDSQRVWMVSGTPFPEGVHQLVTPAATGDRSGNGRHKNRGSSRVEELGPDKDRGHPPRCAHQASQTHAPDSTQLVIRAPHVDASEDDAFWRRQFRTLSLGANRESPAHPSAAWCTG